MHDSTTLYRNCNKCGIGYPRTRQYWQRNKKTQDGLALRCKSCMAAQRREDPDRLERAKQRVREYYASHREHVLAQKKQYYSAHRGAILDKDRACRNNNPARRSEYNRAYRETHREEAIERARKWRLDNPERNKQAVRRWYIEHREAAKESKRRWLAQNQAAVKASRLRRKARKRSLPDTLTGDEWKRALNYWNGCCAVCGRQTASLLNDLYVAADHWIPLASSDCPGTVAENILPLCHGVSGCNNSKQDNDPRKWVLKTFGRQKGGRILRKIDEYFKLVKEGGP